MNDLEWGFVPDDDGLRAGYIYCRRYDGTSVWEYRYMVSMDYLLMRDPYGYFWYAIQFVAERME